MPGADVIVEATRSGFEQFVEIAKRPAAGPYAYTLPVRAKGLKAKANKDGSVTVDPSTSALSNTFDTYVQQGETVDWSTDTDTELDFGNPGTKNADGTARTARSFITWNTTPIQDAR